MMASEFQTWESLYWPESVPRTIPLPGLTSEGIVSSANWRLVSKGRAIAGQELNELVGKVVRSLSQFEKASSFTVTEPDSLAVLVGVSVAFTMGVSAEIIFDPSKTRGTSDIELRRAGSAGNGVPGDFELKKAEGVAQQWTPAEPSVSLVYPDGARTVYSLKDLWGAVESFSAFSSLRGEKGIAVIGSPGHEYGFFTAVSGLITGVPLVSVDDLALLQQALPFKITAAFIAKDSVESSHARSMDDYGKAFGPLRSSLNYIGIEGPTNHKLGRILERACGVPALQMFGISGRGIVLSNPRDFNVHGSVGIPITNAEAIIGDNLEGNWIRDRILMGPAAEGELLVRGAFIDMANDVGDTKQNLVRVGVLDQSTEWLSTGIIGKMDENGYFYLDNASFR